MDLKEPTQFAVVRDGHFAYVRVSQAEIDRNKDHAALLGEKIFDALETINRTRLNLDEQAAKTGA